MNGLAITRNRVQARFNQPRTDSEVPFHDIPPGR
jgi:hypothetical protein